MKNSYSYNPDHGSPWSGLRRIFRHAFVWCWMAGCASAAPALHPQVMRFASEGRSDLRGMELATGNGALPAIRALALQAADNSSNGEGWGILSPMVIPVPKRGVIRVQFATPDPAIRQSVASAGAFITSVVSREWIPTRVIRISALEPGKTRANATHSFLQADIALQPGVLDVATAIHEIGHIIEISHPPVLLASKHFIARRAPKGGPARPLAEITGDPNYEKDEIAFPSNWRARGGTPYTGKFYGKNLNEADATEVISTGLERLYASPRSFFQQDADFFLFMTLTLQCRPLR